MWIWLRPGLTLARLRQTAVVRTPNVIISGWERWRPDDLSKSTVLRCPPVGAHGPRYPYGFG